MARLNNNFFDKYRFLSFIKQIIPLSTRKKIKSYLGKFLVPAVQIIPPEIQKEWDSFKRPPNSFDIINFSVISWNLRTQRPQHLATGMAKLGHRIFYVEHEFISHWNPKSTYAPIQVQKLDTNIYQITLSASRELFIYQEKPSEADKKIILASLKNLINKANIVNPVAKIDHPFWQHITSSLSMPLVYDCMDNHQFFEDSGNDVTKLETDLVKNSSAIITSSQFLHDKFLPIKSVQIPNAGDYSHFSNSKPLKLDIPKPIIGYYGAISHWFDVPLLKAGLKSHPDKSFVLIGKIENQEIQKLSTQYKNLYLFGEKPYADLPGYLANFDVCLIPFLLTPLIKATNPVKIFEYFASGKPVISTALPELKQFSQVIFANSKTISSQISKALKIKNIPSEITIAKNNTWTKRTDQLNKVIQNIFPKVSVIILSYNHPDLMKTALDSVINNSFYPNLEIIVVDNASNKQTTDLLKKYKNIKLILNPKNYGFSKGNNIGLRSAAGGYLILLNNDVIVTPGWVSRLLFHVQKPKVGLVGPVTNSIGNEAKVNYDISNYSSYTHSHWGQTIEVNNIAAFCWVMSRSTYQKVGDLDEQFGRGMFEDDDYCKRIKNLGLKILIADDVFIHHFGAASFSQIPEYQQLFQQNLALFENKWKTKWVPHQYRK